MNVNTKALSAALGLAMVAGVSAPAFAGSSGVNNTYTTSWSVFSTRTTGGSENYYRGTMDSLTTSYKEGYEVGPGGPQIITTHNTTSDSGAFGASFSMGQVGNANLKGVANNPASSGAMTSKQVVGCDDEGEPENCEGDAGPGPGGENLIYGQVPNGQTVETPASQSQISGSVSGIVMAGNAYGGYRNVHDVAHDNLLNVYHIIDQSSNHEVVFFGGSDFSNFSTLSSGGSNSSSHTSSAFSNF